MSSTIFIRVKCETTKQLRDALKELSTTIGNRIEEDEKYISQLTIHECAVISIFSSDFEAKITDVI